MFPFIETAYAMGIGGGGGDGAGMLGGFVPILLIFGIFFFLVIRPQQKRTKQHKNMVAQLSKGDEVYTDSGILGTIQKVSDDSVTLEIAPKVSVRVLRNRIGEKVKESKVAETKEKKGKK